MSNYFLRGADVKLYINGVQYKEVQGVSWTINYNEQPTYGIDSVFPQEISTQFVAVQGQVTGLRIKYSGGLQGKDIRSRINQTLYAPYVKVRIMDRHSDVPLFTCDIKVTQESISIPAKGLANVSFAFTGLIPYSEVDLFPT